MSYAAREIFYSLQGEGAQTGRAAVFCRFAGCNLWSGREEDRAHALCRFCDTDFLGAEAPEGGRFAQAGELAERIAAAWPAEASGRRLVVLTGGEPLLQLDRALMQALREKEFETALETNGTLSAPDGLDWICVSPKAGAPLRQLAGDELKLVFPQSGAEPELYEQLAFRHFFLQPMDGPDRTAHTLAALDYCLRHPQWRLGLQMHKLTGIR